MLEARLVSPSGSLYFAAEATVYNLQTLRMHLRMHLRDLTPKPEDVRVDVRVDAAEAATLDMSGWLRQLADAGVQVRLSPVVSTPRAPNAAA